MGVKEIKLIALIAFAEVLCSVAINAQSIGENAGLDDMRINKQVPIIIQTPERSFYEPSLADFEKCSKDYDSCKQSCERSFNALNAEDCMKTCPKCPILVDSGSSVVQGINDTDYRATKPSVTNTTNIIRLTNAIHIIDSLNITARNENNIHVHSKNSTVGGKFGYGYTENGPCCMVVRNRDHKQRLCGQLCKARVMHAKPVVQCVDDDDINSCKQVVEYKPYRRSRHTSYSTSNRCSYQNEWPYVSCRNRNRRQQGYCSPRCLELAYSYILRYGVPLHCVSCFKNFDKTYSNPPSLGYLPPSAKEEDEFIEEGAWALEKSKCRNPDGTISDDCVNDGEIGSGYDGDGFIFPEDDVRARVDERDRLYADGPRHRRNTFRRSKYSRRNRAPNEAH